MRFKSSTFCSVLVSLILAGPLAAQQAGAVNGLLSDPTGAAVAGAKVTLTSTTTGISRTVITGHDGLYNFPEVNSGDYTVTAEAAGLQKTGGQRPGGGEPERPSRSSSSSWARSPSRSKSPPLPPTLQTADSQMGGVVESKAISDLPLNGRNFTQLMVLMAGATEGSQGDTTQGHYASGPAASPSA